MSDIETLFSLYEKLDNSFNVRYPTSNNATYSSLLNYSDDLKKPFQRWFRYKEGYSIDLINTILDNNDLKKGTILDPFSGSGTTLLASQNKNINSIGFEINPFAYAMSSLKLHNYSKKEISEFKNSINFVLKQTDHIASLPKRDMMKNVFSNKIEKEFLSIKYNIKQLNTSDNVKNLFLLGLISLIEIFSNYKKSGNGLKKRNAKTRYEDKHSFVKELSELYYCMLDDIQNKKNLPNTKTKIIMDTCLNLDKYIKNNTIDGVIFSPPYANCFDYTEIYKLELWFGDFVKTMLDIQKLRKSSLRSHLNANLAEENVLKTTYLKQILDVLLTKKLWDKRIPKMLELYFYDMFILLNKLVLVMKKNAFCNIIVSNSAYGGIVIPTDLIISDYAKNIGFNVDRIEVDRYIITSSQQYKSTLSYKKYLRESIVCLRKK